MSEPKLTMADLERTVKQYLGTNYILTLRHCEKGPRACDACLGMLCREVYFQPEVYEWNDEEDENA